MSVDSAPLPQPFTEKRASAPETQLQADILKPESAKSRPVRSSQTRLQVNTAPKSTFGSVSTGVMKVLAILALIVCQLWLLYRVDRLERGLDYIIPLAENADKYAHTHTWSDARLKANIVDISDPLSNVLALHGVRFDWKTKDFPEMKLGDEPQFGFIAQDVELVYPEIVSTDANGYKMVDYPKLIPILVEAIKEQQTMIELLELRVSTLEKDK